jgi:hypothetical protein
LVIPAAYQQGAGVARRADDAADDYVMGDLAAHLDPSPGAGEVGVSGILRYEALHAVLGPCLHPQLGFIDVGGHRRQRCGGRVRGQQQLQLPPALPVGTTAQITLGCSQHVEGHDHRGVLPAQFGSAAGRAMAAGQQGREVLPHAVGMTNSPSSVVPQRSGLAR